MRHGGRSVKQKSGGMLSLPFDIKCISTSGPLCSDLGSGIRRDGDPGNGERY